MKEKPEWQEISEFSTLAKKIAEKYEDELGYVNTDLIIAYKCTNKDMPVTKTNLYNFAGQKEPESFTNTKKYFFTVFHDVWDTMDARNKQLMVLEALKRIDPEHPESGKVLGKDLHARAEMVRTFGVDWETRKNVPDILAERVRFQNEPKTE